MKDCNIQVPRSSKKKINKAKGTLSNIVTQNSEKVKHKKGKQQTEVKMPIQIIWESRNISKDLLKNLCPYSELLMNLPPFFKPTPSSRRGGKHHQLAVLNPFPVCFHYLKGGIPVILHYFWLHYLPLLKSAWVREILTALKKIKSHIYHPVKVQSFQSTSRVMSSWYLTPLKVLQQNQGGESQGPPMSMLCPRDSTLQQKENCISIRMNFQAKGCV